MCHVLVIEDEWIVAEHLSIVAEDAGATSMAVAATERDAVGAARARRPDLILSDVRLAEGAGPAAVASIIREHGPTHVIFVTGTPEECVPCDPPAVVLTKPVDARAVTRCFRELIGAA